MLMRKHGPWGGPIITISATSLVTVAPSWAIWLRKSGNAKRDGTTVFRSRCFVYHYPLPFVYHFLLPFDFASRFHAPRLSRVIKKTWATLTAITGFVNIFSALLPCGRQRGGKHECFKTFSVLLWLIRTS